MPRDAALVPPGNGANSTCEAGKGNQTVISRRTLVSATAAIPLVNTAAQAVPVPKPGKIGFRLLRDKDVIGSHWLTFTQQDNLLTVAVSIDILVKFGPIPVYRYAHRATERWTGDRFDAIESTTNKDGTKLWMRAERGPQGVKVEGSQTAAYIAPPMALPTTYWNQAMLQGQVINSEDGQLFNVSAQAMAEENVRLADGTRIRAQHWRLAGDLRLDLWYDAEGEWARLLFDKDGTTIVYEKL